MTTDELRAKFEAWMAGREGFPFARQYANLMWVAYQAAYASRDAEVEALRKDAERYRWIRNTDYEDMDETLTRGMSVDFSVSIRQGEDLDKAIDAAMREESK